MNAIVRKAKAGVTLVELLVVILIITILSVSLLPLLKPYIEQSKYAAEVQPTLANIQTKINLYQYEKDKLPCTQLAANGDEDMSHNDQYVWTWWLDTSNTLGQKVYKKARMDAIGTAPSQAYAGTDHLTDCVEVDWQDLMGKRINPAQFFYHVIKGKGAAKYGYVVAVFGDGNGLAKGTGYAVLVLVDTDNHLKLVGTWERYKPVKDAQVTFAIAQAGGTTSKDDSYCYIPAYANLNDATAGTAKDYKGMLTALKNAGWSFNFDDSIGTTSSNNTTPTNP